MVTLRGLTERLLATTPPIGVRFQFAHSMEWYDFDKDDDMTKLALGKEVIGWYVEEVPASGKYARKYNVSAHLYINVLLNPRYDWVGL